MNIVACFPEQQADLVEQFLVNRKITNYTLEHELSKLEEVLVKADHQSTLYIFDFTGEGKFYDIYRRYVKKIKFLKVITTKSSTADAYSPYTDAVYFIRPMMDLTSLFWDSSVFKLDNAVAAAKAGKQLIDIEEFDVSGIRIDKLDLTFEIKTKEGIDSLVVNGKTKGTPLTGEVKRSILDIIKGKKKEILTQLEFGDEAKSDVPEGIYYKGEDEDSVTEMEMIERISSLNHYLRSAEYRDIYAYLEKNKWIQENVSKFLKNLRIENKISGTLGELNYLLNKERITESQYIEALRDFYKVDCSSRIQVARMQPAFDMISIELCKELKCFVIEGFNRDTANIVVDYDNDEARRRIGLMFNNYRWVYAREQDIMERLSKVGRD